GLSHTNASWLPSVRILADTLPNVKWVIPQAETGPVSYDQGAEGPRWFDVHVLPPSVHEDDTLTALASKQRIQQIIDDEIAKGVPPNKILLIGFSQGAAMALLAGLTFEHTLAGIGVLSGWIPPMLKETVTAHQSAPCPPLFWAHGTADTLIPLDNALETMQWLRSSSLQMKETSLTYNEYLGMGHKVNDNVLRDLSAWIALLL
ncbi:Phospholipase/carboxylesterase, partial [Ramaria rubella]